MKTAEIRRSILKTLLENECYGYQIHENLRSQNREVEIGRLYKVLKSMLTEGILSCRWEKSERGPEKRVYKLTGKGRKELNQYLLEAIDAIHGYYREYLSNLPNEISIFEGFAKLIVPQPKAQCKVVFYAPRFSAMHEKLLTSLLNRLTEAETCLVHQEADTEFSIKSMMSLHGGYDSIPLRARYGDLLIIDGLPSEEDSQKAATEWQRVLKETGTLVVLAPRAVFFKLKDPLTIGDFIEKMEHQASENKGGKGEDLQHLLEKHFHDVQKKEMLHMVFLIAREPNRHNSLT